MKKGVVITTKLHGFSHKYTDLIFAVFGIAATLSSRVLAQLSTVRDAGGLICRVRDETGSFPAAMAAMPIPVNPIVLY